MNDKLNEAVIKAVKETFKAVTGDVVLNDEPTQKRISNSSGETSVVISILGEVSGAVTLRCSASFAASVASKMIGMDVDPASADMKDAVGELLNMIVGATKGYYATGNDPFKISLPTTIIGGDYTVYIKANPSAEVSLIPFTCNGEKINVEVFVS